MGYIHIAVVFVNTEAEFYEYWGWLAWHQFFTAPKNW